jgi:diacylglycerol kinase family enzyme
MSPQTDSDCFDGLGGARRVRPWRPVLLCNPWSGGGKVERFGLKAMADELGVDAVFLDKGLDLSELARDAVARGADCLGMAGGDGSQALVAAIAHEYDIPFVCISAGTRNHFAQDLGLDKEDPRQGMIAFRDGVERFIDYATVADRLFVNNVSLGVYGTIVQQESYRNAKLETAMRMLPGLLSREAEPFDLQFTTPDGVEIEDPFVLQISNNPYVWTPSPEFAQRSTMDSGKLGVFAVNAGNGHEAAEIIERVLTGQQQHDQYLHEFTAERFGVRSRSGKAFAGIDGEAVELETPLEFRSHPRGLRMLVPEDVIAASERRRSGGYGREGLREVLSGRQPPLPSGHHRGKGDRRPAPGRR